MNRVHGFALAAPLARARSVAALASSRGKSEVGAAPAKVAPRAQR